MKIKVISFNIRCADDENGNSIKERAPRLAAIVGGYDADIIGLQEFTPNWEAYIPQLFGEEYEFFNKYRTDTGWIESAPILWRKDKFKCITRGYFWLSETPEMMSGGWDDYGYNRICLYAVLQEIQTGKTFAFINTHFGFGDDNQVKSVRLLHRYAEKMFPNPVVVTGDFNMIPSSPAYAEMLKKMDDVNALTVKDRRSTFHGYHPEVDANEHIDYCFISKEVTPLAFKIVDELVNNQFPSDHYGIYAEVEI